MSYTASATEFVTLTVEQSVRRNAYLAALEAAREAGAKFQTRCTCGAITTRKYAKEHGGRCKACFELREDLRPSNTPTREQRILEHGYDAYAREEGHYDAFQGNE